MTIKTPTTIRNRRRGLVIAKGKERHAWARASLHFHTWRGCRLRQLRFPLSSEFPEVGNCFVFPRGGRERKVNFIGFSVTLLFCRNSSADGFGITSPAADRSPINGRKHRAVFSSVRQLRHEKWRAQSYSIFVWGYNKSYVFISMTLHNQPRCITCLLPLPPNSRQSITRIACH